jgi:hypothetical protein
MRRMKADHWAAANARAASGERESRTNISDPALAISTQVSEPLLNLLLRQTSVKCRLCRLGIQHPSVRRAALLLAAARDEGVDLGQESTGQRRPLLADIPR